MPPKKAKTTVKKPQNVNVQNIEVAKLAVNTVVKNLDAAKSRFEISVKNTESQLEKLEETITARAQEILEQEVKAQAAFEANMEEHNKAMQEAKARFEEVKASQDAELTTRQKMIEETLRESELELRIKVRDNENALMAEMAQKHKKVFVDQEDWDKVLTENSSANESREKAILAATEKAVLDVTQQKDFEIERLKLSNDAEKAALVANNDSLHQQLEAAKEEITRLSKQIDDNREAMIKMQEANSKPSIMQTVGNGK